METENRIEALILEAQNWEEHAQLGSFAKEVIAVVERLQRELERRDAEIAALRSVINDIEEVVMNETVNPPKLQSWIVHRIHEGVTVLDTKPDAAPVEIRGEMCGCGSRNTANTEGSTWWFKCEDCGFVFDAAGSRATLVEAWRAWKAQSEPVEPPAREIAVGDRVWVDGMEATVHTVPQDETGDYVIALFGVDATHYRHVPRSKIRPR